ncbi:MAG: efflux RND transporter permease subunit, partial [Acidobacteriota bacterium]
MIGIAIPISVVATFFLMYAFDVSLNIMSLGGLTLGIGLLVDNAIVVLESIERRRGEGLGAREAARRGAGEVSSAIIAATATTICVFLPVIFVEGVAAQFFADQALTVTFSLLASLVVALTVIPMLASRQLPSDAEDAADAPDDGRLVRASSALTAAVVRVLGAALKPLAWLVERPALLFQSAFRGLAVVYRRALAGALERPLFVLGVAVALLAVSLWGAGGLGGELVPELSQGEFFVDVELPPGTHLDVTERRMAILAASIGGLENVGRVYALAGSTGQEGGIAAENREHLGRLTISVAPPFSKAREAALVNDVRAVLDADTQLNARFGRPSFFSFEKPIEIELRGFNLTLLRRLSESLVSGLRGTSGFADVESSAEGGTPELQIRFDRERLASLGLTVGEVASVVRTKVRGDVASEIQRQDRTIDIRLRVAEAYRSSVADVRQLIVAQVGGTSLPLESLATVEVAEGPAEIRRVDGERAALITANLDGLDLAAAAVAIEDRVEGLALPTGFDWRLGGQQQEMETSFASLRLALALAIFLVYLVMASQFESLVHPFVILFSVPLAAVGVIGTLHLFEVRVSVVVLIGGVLLAGIVVNNAIILVDTANRLRRER